jgi:hypothetical protein
MRAYSMSRLVGTPHVHKKVRFGVTFESHVMARSMVSLCRRTPAAGGKADVERWRLGFALSGVNKEAQAATPIISNRR